MGSASGATRLLGARHHRPYRLRLPRGADRAGRRGWRHAADRADDHRVGGPTASGGLLAKQAATLQAVSGGRFRLGLGIGGRDDDWLALGEEPKNKGKRLEECIATCRSVWAGEKPDGALLPVGPKPPHLPIVLGGNSDSSYRRAGRLADAVVAGPVPPEAVAGAYEVVKASAAEAQREAPALYAARYVAIGDDVADEADRNARSYYGDLAPYIQGGILRSSDDVRESLDSLEQVGVVETCLWPMARGIDQVDRIADAALQVAV